jgi:hypothetical protein
MSLWALKEEKYPKIFLAGIHFGHQVLVKIIGKK